MKRILLSLLVAVSVTAWADTVVEFHGADDAVTYSEKVNTASVMTFGGTGVELGNLKVPYGDILRVTFRSDASGIAQNSLQGCTLRVTPNPVADQLTVVGADGADVAVYDAAGRIMLARRAYDGHAINAANLAPGVYFVTAGRQTLKFVKK